MRVRRGSYPDAKGRGMQGARAVKGCERRRRGEGRGSGERSGEESENERWMLARDRSGHVRQHPFPHSFFSSARSPFPATFYPSLLSLSLLPGSRYPFCARSRYFSCPRPCRRLFLARDATALGCFPDQGRYRSRSNRKCGSSPATTPAISNSLSSGGTFEVRSPSGCSRVLLSHSPPDLPASTTSASRPACDSHAHQR